MAFASALRSRGSSFRLVLPLDRLHNQAIANGLGADLGADDLAVDHSADALDVRAELAGGDARDLRPDAAKVLGLAAMGDLVSEGGLLAGEITNARHNW